MEWSFENFDPLTHGPFKDACSSVKNRQLDGAVHPGASRSACGRIEHQVSGSRKPARILF